MISKYLENVLEAIGFKKPIDHNPVDAHEGREMVSLRYIRGKGLEIGALHCPLPVPGNVKVRYIDRVMRDESVRKFPELDASKIVNPNVIDDGFTLSSIHERSQDFVIANHVLEHSPNPIQTLITWSKVLGSRGLLFLSVPIVDRCFDKGRSLTPTQHLFDDYYLCQKNDREQFDLKNRNHYLEWITISVPNISKERGQDYTIPSDNSLEEKLDRLVAEEGEIHFHTFTVDSFKDFLSTFISEIDQTFRIEAIVENYFEVIGVMRKY